MTNDIVLTLGDVEFAKFEVPETINFGGEQLLKKHTLVGGRVVIDAMGAVTEPIEWSGWLTGENAVKRAQQLDSLRQEGKQLTLTWSEFIFHGVVRKFHADFQMAYRIPYKISFEVVEDLTSVYAAINDLMAEPSMDDLINDDINQAAGLASLVNDNPLNGFFSELNTITKTINSYTAMAQRDMGLVLGIVNNIRGRCQLLMNSVNMAIGTFTPMHWVTGSNNITQQIATSQQLMTISQLMGRSLNNLNTLNGGTKKLTVGAGNMLQIASSQYGDAMGWTAIAQANNMNDPFLSGIQSLIIPTFGNNTGGVLNGGY